MTEQLISPVEAIVALFCSLKQKPESNPICVRSGFTSGAPFDLRDRSMQI
jgi:hypothetical protein